MAFAPDHFVHLFSMSPIEKRERDTLAFDKRQRDPLWREPSYYKERTEMRKHGHPHQTIEDLTDQVRAGEIGKNVAHMWAKAAHDASGFDIDRKDARGKVMSDEQQFQHFLENHPIGKAFRQACAQGLESTPDEVEKEMKAPRGGRDLDEAHERQRQLGSGHDGRNERAVTKTLSSVCWAEITRMAEQLVKRAKVEKGIVLSIDKAREVIMNGTEKGKQLAKLEKFNRLGI
jgi:hypothetical protein